MNNTLKKYNENAKEYFEQTKAADMREIYNHFLLMLPKSACILDFGCGSGRDSKFFLEKGYEVKAIDGSSSLCKLASEYIGQDVECMRFDELSDVSKYDGIWACASLLHVERKELPSIFKKMLLALKDNGVIYASFKKGDQEIIIDDKYYNYVTREILEKILEQIDIKSEIVDYFETETFRTVDRPFSVWENYLIKRK